jgi:hypothetical protein
MRFSHLLVVVDRALRRSLLPDQGGGTSQYRLCICRMFILLPHPCEFDLRGDGMLRICVDRTQHGPIHTTTWSTTIKECRRSRVDGQVPCGEL